MIEATLRRTGGTSRRPPPPRHRPLDALRQAEALRRSQRRARTLRRSEEQSRRRRTCRQTALTGARGPRAAVAPGCRRRPETSTPPPGEATPGIARRAIWSRSELPAGSQAGDFRAPQQVAACPSSRRRAGCRKKTRLVGVPAELPTTSPSTGESDADAAPLPAQAKPGPLLAAALPTAGRSRASGLPTRRVARSSRPSVTVPSSSRLHPGVAAVVEAVGRDVEAAGVDCRGAPSRRPRGGRASRTPCSRRRARSARPGSSPVSVVAAAASPRRAAPRTPRARGSRRPGRGRRRAGPRRSPRRASRRRSRGRARRRPGRSRGRVDDEVGVAGKHLETSVSPSSRALAPGGRG